MTASKVDWSEVDRAIMKAGEQLRQGKNTEDFQVIGLLCREALISLSQAVFVPIQHKVHDGTIPSKTDSKRMLDAFFMSELSGGANEEARRHARASISLADSLVHRRTANYRDAALCIEATQSTANLVSIITGRTETERIVPANTEPFRIPKMGDSTLDSIVEYYKNQGLELAFPLFEEKDVRLAKGYRVAHYPETHREVWVGFHGGRYEHILMIKPIPENKA
jgi:hypothetical protein